MFVRGHSKGGAGTIYTTLFNQDRIAGGLSDTLRPNVAPLGLPSGNKNICGNSGYNMFRYADTGWWIQNNPDKADFWIESDHAKDDRAAVFWYFNYPSPVAGDVSWFDVLQQARVGHYFRWDEGGHNRNNGSWPVGVSGLPGGGDAGASTDMDPVLGFHWWDGGWDPILDPTTYLRLNLSFPAFTNYSYDEDYGVGPSGSECMAMYGANGCRGDVAIPNDNRYSGAIAGVSNRHLRWNSNTIGDTADVYSIDIRILDDIAAKPVGGSCGEVAPPGGAQYPSCYDDYVGSGSETVDVTPRRLQTFAAAPGEEIEWESSVGPSGVVNADEHGVVTVPAFEVTTEWRTLTLRRMAGSGVPDAGGGETGCACAAGSGSDVLTLAPLTGIVLLAMRRRRRRAVLGAAGRGQT